MGLPRIIAFYLPQYHPIPENDEWWGKGFTEWTNVAKARPLFKGHYQPHLPADLGFYDLRVPEVREQQAELAREAGIDGFCYYHYWFNGKQLLERPFREVLESGKPDFPFCLCWANENWTRRWDGKENEVLMNMSYSPEDDHRHIRALLPAFEDKRYIRVDGKPVFLVYRAHKLPNPLETALIWRDEAKKAGLKGLFLCLIGNGQSDPSLYGFDAEVEFQPNWNQFNTPMRRTKFWRLLMKFGIVSEVYRKFNVMEYRTLVERALGNADPNYLRFPCVTPRWDNSARKQNHGHILRNSTPNLYSYWLKETIRRNCSKDLIFINAWNEWAEGNHLEPDLKYSKAYLDATREAIKLSVDSNCVEK